MAKRKSRVELLKAFDAILEPARVRPMDEIRRGRVIAAAADCGIDARSMTLAEVRAAHNAQRAKRPRYADQFDMALDTVLTEAEEVTRG